MKKFLSLMLALAMVLSLAACGNNAETPSNSAAPSQSAAPSDSAEPSAEPKVFDDLSSLDYDEQSAQIFDEALGEFMEYYEAGKAEGTDLGKRFALMAQAEAKLMEAAVYYPTNRNGGSFAISRIAPGTINTTMWGNDSDRFHDAVVCTTFIKSEDRVALKEMWTKLKGTGTYEEECKKYLTEKGYEFQDFYGNSYSSDPQTWDMLGTSRAADSEAIVNCIDGLYEYDMENVQQPALAESYEVAQNEDGTETYTFKLRQGVKWVDSQGREVGEVKADDWVAGLQHMMDTMGGLEYLVDGVIVGVHEYINDGDHDMSKVGVKAVDDYTLQYTLEKHTSYFMTMLGYGVFAPLCRSYYESQGGQFGDAFDSSLESYTFGKTPNNIAYCGPYLVTSYTANNSITFTANPSYWDAANINIKTINWLLEDGSDPTKMYVDAKNDLLCGSGLSPTTLELAKKETVGDLLGDKAGDDAAKTIFDAYHYQSSTDATSFGGFLNLNRSLYHNFNDENTCVSTKAEDEMLRSKAALRNVHFRRALVTGFDRGAYNAERSGEELKFTNLANSYTPAHFLTLDNETTIDINGTSKTFPAGTYYGEVMQAQLDADGCPIKVIDMTIADGAPSGDGFDGWYNPEYAKAELETAIAELAEYGFEVSKENPIHIDYPYPSSIDVFNNMANVYKQSIEENLGGCVVVDLVDGIDYTGWYNCGYYGESGQDANYDVYTASGWGPDYGDPQTYLDTFLPDYAGYMTKSLGVY